MLRILFCGGGSLGHLAPCIAIWEAMQTKEMAVDSLFVCAPREEERTFLQRYEVRFVPLHAPKGALSLQLFLFPFHVLLACLEAFSILLRFRPQVIFAKGGYVSPPVCFMGWILHIPIVLHESDQILGRANRMLLRCASHLCIGTPRKELDDMNAILRKGIAVTATGNPVREELLKGSAGVGKNITGFSGKRPVLLVIGGSQGSEALNVTVAALLDPLLNCCDVIHLTGMGKSGSSKQHARYIVREFVDGELPHFYALANVVLSRAGASVLAELAALRKAAILVPLPTIAQKHQEENARFLELAKAAVVLRQETLPETLLPTLQHLFAHPEEQKRLGEQLHTFAVPDAAMQIANILLETAGEQRTKNE